MRPLPFRSLLPPVFVALLLCAPTFFMDHYNDDWIFRATMMGRVPTATNHPLALYEFITSPEQVRADINEGMLPWWTTDQLKLRFFRPLSSLTLWIDHALFGPSALPAHIHSLLWFAAFLFVAARLLYRLLPQRAATWALWSLAFASNHASTAMWPSARNGLCAATVALLPITMHLGDRLEDKPARPWAVAALFALSLLFAETALGVVPILCMIELMAVRKPYIERARAVGPTVGVALLYLAFYSISGYGVRGSTGYLDPMRETAAFVSQVPQRWLVMMTDALLGVPSEISWVAPQAVPVLASLGALCAAVIAWALHRTRSDREPRTHAMLCALAVGSTLAVLPTLGGVLGGRLLALAAVGYAAVFGALADSVLSRWKRRRIAASIALFFLVVPMLIGALWNLAQGALVVQSSRAQRTLGNTQFARCAPDADRILIEGTDPSLGMYGGAAITTVQNLRGSFRVLSMDPLTHVLTRTGPQTITLTPQNGSFINAPFSRIYRGAGHDFQRGDVVRVKHAVITVREVEAGHPKVIEVAFERPFEGGQTCLVRWHNRALEAFEAPAMGASITLPHELGPMGM